MAGLATKKATSNTFIAQVFSKNTDGELKNKTNYLGAFTNAERVRRRK
jgi:hypothetical protein